MLIGKVHTVQRVSLIAWAGSILANDVLAARVARDNHLSYTKTTDVADIIRLRGELITAVEIELGHAGGSPTVSTITNSEGCTSDQYWWHK